MSFNHIDWSEPLIAKCKHFVGSQKSDFNQSTNQTNVISKIVFHFRKSIESNHGSEFDNKMRCNAHTQTDFRLIRLRLLIKMVTCLHYINLILLLFLCSCERLFLSNVSDGSDEDMLTQAKNCHTANIIPLNVTLLHVAIAIMSYTLRLSVGHRLSIIESLSFSLLVYLKFVKLRSFDCCNVCVEWRK